MFSYIANRNHLFRVAGLAALVVISAASVYGQPLPAASVALAQNAQDNTAKGIQTGPAGGGTGSKPAIGKPAPSRAGS